MTARLVFNEEGYIERFFIGEEGYTLPEDFDLRYIYCYHLVDGQIVLDESRKADQIEKEMYQIEIEDLKKKLSETDFIFIQELEEISSLSSPVTFITDLIKILVSYSTKYKDIISNRKAWRDRIKELEG